MDLVNVNKQALAQTYYIINSFHDINKNKVPLYLKNMLYEYMDKDYQYNKEQEYFMETKEILYAILYKYILDDKQKEKINEYIKFYDCKNEEQKLGKYELNFKEQLENTIDSNMQLIKVENKNIVLKIIEKIKSFFYR